MYPETTYARLYDEVTARTEGKDPFEPGLGTVWVEQGAAERRMVRARAEALWERAEAYAREVEAFDRVHRTLNGLPEERGEAYRAALPDDLTRWETSPWQHLSAGEDTVWLRYWVTYNATPISEAEDAEQFERLLRDNLEPMREHDAYNAGDMAAVYDGWDEQGVDWAEELWAFVTDGDLGLKELAEERRQHNRAIAEHAQTLEGELGARLDRYADLSLWERLKDRLL